MIHGGGVICAAVPFAKAGHLLAGLAGIQLTGKRIEWSAEADGAAAAAAITAQADAICSRQVIPLPPPAPAPDMLYLAVDGKVTLTGSPSASPNPAPVISPPRSPPERT